MKEKIEKIAESLFLFLLIVQFIAAAAFNLYDIRCSLDHDAANTFYHFMEVIKNGTMKLPDWNHTTTLELDGSFLFAIPLYFVTKDIFLSVGISNIILMILYLFTISRILHHAGAGRKFMYLTLCLVLTPYSFGMLEYFNMMFFGGACYSVKTLVPLLFILVIQLLSEEREREEKGQQAKGELRQGAKRAEFIIAFVLYFVLLFVTAFSTGMYTMLCGLLPVFICILIDIWTEGTNRKKYNQKHAVMLAGTLVLFTAGYILHNHFYPLTSRMDMKLTKIENYAVNFRACVAGIFQLFGAATSQDIETVSFWGIIYCLKMGLVVLFLAVFFYNVPRIFKKTEKPDVRKYLTFLFLFNFLVLLVADCRYSDNTHIEYRYYLIGAVPLILLLGIQLSEWEGFWDGFQKQLIHMVILLALSGIVVGNTLYVREHWDRTTYAVELCDYFNTLDIDSVFFVNDPDTSIICKGIDQNHKYGAYMTETQSLNLSICSYNASAHGSFYGESNALAVLADSNLSELIPPEIAEKYTKIGTIRWYDIYLADKVYFP